MRVRYVGETVEHLTGHWVDVPDDIPLHAATSWIELNLASENNDESFDAESEDFDEPEKDGAAAEMDRVSQMQSQLDELNTRLENPDVSRAAEAISSTARAIQSSWDISRDLQKLEEQARSQTSINQALSSQAQAFAESATAQRKKTIDLIGANQKIVNNAFSSYSGEMKNLRKNLAEADYEIRMLKKAASENSALLQKAGSIIKSWEARA